LLWLLPHVLPQLPLLAVRQGLSFCAVRLRSLAELGRMFCQGILDWTRA
jgi:hypothetical protein